MITTTTTITLYDADHSVWAMVAQLSLSAVTIAVCDLLLFFILILCVTIHWTVRHDGHHITPAGGSRLTQDLCTT
jgi:hypothetical protein